MLGAPARSEWRLSLQPPHCYPVADAESLGADVWGLTGRRVTRGLTEPPGLGGARRHTGRLPQETGRAPCVWRGGCEWVPESRGQTGRQFLVAAFTAPIAFLSKKDLVWEGVKTHPSKTPIFSMRGGRGTQVRPRRRGREVLGSGTVSKQNVGASLEGRATWPLASPAWRRTRCRPRSRRLVTTRRDGPGLGEGAGATWGLRGQGRDVKGAEHERGPRTPDATPRSSGQGKAHRGRRGPAQRAPPSQASQALHAEPEHETGVSVSVTPPWCGRTCRHRSDWPGHTGSRSPKSPCPEWQARRR